MYHNIKDQINKQGTDDIKLERKTPYKISNLTTYVVSMSWEGKRSMREVQTLLVVESQTNTERTLLMTYDLRSVSQLINDDM